MSRSSPRTAAPPCLPLDIKDLLKEDARLFAFGALDIKDLLKEDARLFAFGAFALEAFALRILFWAFGVLTF
jgi:hypothetical protein